jgi:hypothetical protein
VAERKNRTIMNTVVTLLATKRMPKAYWAEAVVWAYYVHNRCPTKALQEMTPQESWTGEKPNVAHFKTWGCVAHIHVPKEKRTKLEDKSITCILLGLNEESKGYRVLDPKTRKIIVSKDVLFEEHKSWDWDQGIKKERES